MIKIRTSPVPTAIHVLKTALETRGIACEVRGEMRGAAVGELPPNECWVELWLVDPSQKAEAEEIIRAAQSTSGVEWTCGDCGETVDAGFGQCWNCQSYRP